MYALLIVLYAYNGFGITALATTSIPGFTSKESCEIEATKIQAAPQYSLLRREHAHIETWCVSTAPRK